MAVLKNRAKMSTSTTGTGTITLGSAEDGYQTFADAGVVNSDVVRYVIEDGSNWEIGTGTYTATGTTLSRTVSESSNSDAAINLSGSATVFIGATAEDIPALYAANEVSPTAQPSATGSNAIAIGDSAVASGTDALAFGDGATSSSTRSTAIGYNSTSSSIASVAIGANANSSQFYSVAIGSPSNGSGSVATGGASAIAINGRASGTDSLAAAIANNTSSYGATGTYSIAIGYRAKASGSASSIAVGLDAISSGRASIAMGEGATASADSAVCLGEDSTTSGANGSIIGGYLNTASGSRSAILGGYSNSATVDYSIAMGSQAKSDKYGKIAHATGAFANAGDAQGGIYVLRADTTDATATVLTTNNSTAAATNQIVAASDTCITFDGTITAMQNGAQAYASWKIEGLLVNDGGTTTLADSATTVIQNLSSWGMALSADNTNNALAITCTGEASHNIRWVANIRTTEVTYA
jgi:hypothetical protein